MFLGIAAGSAAAEIVVYPRLQDMSGSSVYSVTVNGQPVPVTLYRDKSIAWFAFSGTASVSIKVSQPIGSYTLSPQRKPVALASVNGDTLSFSLTEPRKLVLHKVNALSESLILFADPLEQGAPVLGVRGVFNIVSAGADPTGRSDSTSAINQTIAAASSYGAGGVAYVPAGTFNFATTLFLKSNVNLYLAPGAVLRIPRGSTALFTDGKAVLGDQVINAKITGRGMIYGNGSTNVAFNHLVHTKAASDFLIQDVMLIDPYTTPLRLAGDRHTVRNVKILAEPYKGGLVLADGMDLDYGNNTVIDNSFVLSTDDIISINYGGNVANPSGSDGLTFTNSVFWHTATGNMMRILPCHKTYYVRNILFDNNDVVSVGGVVALNAVGFPGQTGVLIENITVRNIRVEEVRSRPFDVIVPDTTKWNLCGPNTNPATCMCAQYPTGNIRNVKFSDITIDNAPKEYSLIYGNSAAAAVDGVNFNNVTMAGVPLTQSNYRTQGNFMHDATYATNITFTADSGVNQPPSVTANTPPAVSLTAPVSGATYTAPATITLTAAASDPDGKIARVEFWQGPNKLGEASAAPYTWTIQGAPEGVYSGQWALTAKAFDNSGAVTTSNAVDVTVAAAANKPPAVTLTAPASGATVPPTFTMTATASDPDGSIARVEFWQGPNKLGERSKAPYTWTIYGAPAGVYSGQWALTAKAFDNSGAVTTSNTVNVTVAAANKPPTVTLTAPASGATVPTTFTMTATASDPDGSIARVEFWQGPNKLGERSKAPYTWTVYGALPGIYNGQWALTAKAIDNSGAATTSNAVNVTVKARR